MQSTYRIYSRISRKIYNQILIKKWEGDLYAGHKKKKFLQLVEPVSLTGHRQPGEYAWYSFTPSCRRGWSSP